MITIQNKNGQACPCVVCDHCGDDIVDASQASVVWQETLDTARTPSETFYFVHYFCDHAFEASNALPGKTWCSSALGTWLVYLTNNVKWNEAQSRRNASVLAGI